LSDIELSKAEECAVSGKRAFLGSTVLWFQCSTVKFWNRARALEIDWVPASI